jgi:hypothetical protein
LECPPKKTQAYARAYEGVYDFILLHYKRTIPFWEKSGKKVGKNADFLPCPFMSSCVERFFEKKLKYFNLGVVIIIIWLYNIIKKKEGSGKHEILGKEELRS